MTINTLELNSPIWFLHKSALSVTKVNSITVTCNSQSTTIQYDTNAGFRFFSTQENITWWSSKENLINHISNLNPTPEPTPTPKHNSLEDAFDRLFSDKPTPKPTPTPINATLHEVINSIFNPPEQKSKCKCGGNCQPLV